MYRRPLLCLLLGATVALAACNSDSSNSGDDSPPATPDAAVATDGAVPGPDAFVPPADSYSLTWGPVTVQPGDEGTRCVTLDLANAAALHIGQIHNELTGGSHHLIVYRTTDPLAPMADCTPFSGTLHPDKTSPLMITQRHDETLELPQGVAFTFAASQHIRLEMHFINTTDAPLEVTGTSTFIPLADADFQQEADFLFIGTPDIDIAAGAAKTIGPVFFPMQPGFADANYFAMTGHTHRYGVNVHVASATSAGDSGTPIYEHTNWLWSEPETEYYAPAFKVPSGGGFKFSCEYKNTGTSAVSFGESANDEMCFFWAYYYPSTGPHVCIHTTRFGGAFDGCCPDLPALCDAIDGFLSNN